MPECYEGPFNEKLFYPTAREAVLCVHEVCGGTLVNLVDG